MTRLELMPGLVYCPDYLDRSGQEALLAAIYEITRAAPLVRPRMPRTGRPFSVRMTNCGSLGWVSDETGYRYQGIHPETGQPWPPMPPGLLAAWRQLSGTATEPEACLVNVYDAQARMGLHQDRDEANLDAPVVSLSLGDTAVFRYGGLDRRAPTRSLKLRSGDALVLGGPARLIFHGVDRILAGSSDLLAQGGRINLTLRKVLKST